MKTQTHQSGQRGRVPNSRFPVLIHRNAVPGGGKEPVRDRCSGWMDNVIFGKGDERVRLNAGDILVMPAGDSHEMVGHSDDVMMTGGYPDGRDWDNMQEEFLSEEDYRAAA